MPTKPRSIPVLFIGVVLASAGAPVLTGCLGASVQLADPPRLGSAPRPPPAPDPEVAIQAGTDPSRVEVSKVEPAPLPAGAQMALLGVAAACPGPLATSAQWTILATAINRGVRVADLTGAHDLAVVRSLQSGGESTEWRGTLAQAVGLGRMTPGAAVLEVALACGTTAAPGDKRTYSYSAKALAQYEGDVQEHRTAARGYVDAAEKAMKAWDAEYARAVKERDSARNGWNRFWASVADLLSIPVADGGYGETAKEMRERRAQVERAAQALASPKELRDSAAKRVELSTEPKPSVHIEARLTDTKGGHLLALVAVDRTGLTIEAALNAAIADMYGAMTPAPKKGGR